MAASDSRNLPVIQSHSIKMTPILRDSHSAYWNRSPRIQTFHQAAALCIGSRSSKVVSVFPQLPGGLPKSAPCFAGNSQRLHCPSRSQRLFRRRLKNQEAVPSTQVRLPLVHCIDGLRGYACCFFRLRSTAACPRIVRYKDRVKIRKRLSKGQT